MANNKISDLRAHLFAALEGLKDKDAPMDIERARAISDVAQTIINSAKVEIELVKAVNGSRPASLDFFGIAEEEEAVPRLPNPVTALARREKKMDERMPWPEDYAAVEPLARKRG